MASARSKGTYTSLWDGCPLLPARVYDIETAFRPNGFGEDANMTRYPDDEINMAPETDKTTCRRKARGISRYIVLLGQCHLNLIWKPRSICYRGHGIIQIYHYGFVLT